MEFVRLAEETGCKVFQFTKIQFRTAGGGCRYMCGFAIGVVGVGGEAKADHAFVGFFRTDVKLRQAGETAGHEREYAGGQRIERTEMADGALLKDAAHSRDDIVRGPSGGLVDDDDAIHGMGGLSDRAIGRFSQVFV